MLIAGGSGITCVLNALEEIIANSASGRRAVLRVRIVYVLRGLDRNRYFVELLSDLARRAASRTPLVLDVLVYDSSSIVPETGWSFGGKDGAASICLSLHAGRPDLLGLLDQLLAEQAPSSPSSAIGGGVVLLSCGPRSLVSAVSLPLRCRGVPKSRAGLMRIPNRRPDAPRPSVDKIWLTERE